MKQIQGGYLCAMLDECMSVACMVASGMTAVAPTLEMKTSFFRPGAPGKIRGVGRVVKWGRQVASPRGELFDPDGRLLAKATARRSPPPSRPTRNSGRLALLFAGLWLAFAAPAQAASPFADWAVVVVAGDWHAIPAGPSEAFDNARRDVALERAGFQQANLRQFSVRPERYKDAGLAKSDPNTIFESLVDLTGKATGGCLVYFSSHGAPQGVVVDQQILPPPVLAGMLDRTCGARPTVVVISACFSGVFVPALAGANRMVLTAARPDRSSFGCGEADRYPYFDECFLSSIAEAKTFPSLATAVQACVATREVKEGMKPPSEPQLFIGGALRPLLPLYQLVTGPPRAN